MVISLVACDGEVHADGDMDVCTYVVVDIALFCFVFWDRKEETMFGQMLVVVPVLDATVDEEVAGFGGEVLLFMFLELVMVTRLCIWLRTPLADFGLLLACFF